MTTGGTSYIPSQQGLTWIFQGRLYMNDSLCWPGRSHDFSYHLPEVNSASGDKVSRETKFLDRRSLLFCNSVSYRLQDGYKM